MEERSSSGAGSGSQVGETFPGGMTAHTSWETTGEGGGLSIKNRDTQRRKVVDNQWDISRGNSSYLFFDSLLLIFICHTLTKHKSLKLSVFIIITQGHSGNIPRGNTFW